MSVIASIEAAGETISPETRRLGLRRDRYAARYTLWAESTLERVRACGRFVQDREAGVQVRVRTDSTGSHAALAGAQTCGSVWACPVCSEKIQAERQLEVAAAIETALERGWRIGFATFTVRHRGGAGRSLKAVWEACSTAWRAATAGAGPEWKQDKSDAGLVGYVRLFETTQGARNGWHVHVHALLFSAPDGKGDGGPYWRDLERLGASMFDRWRGSLEGTPFEPDDRHGFDLRPVLEGSDLAAYFAKGVYGKKAAAASFEVTQSHGKQTKHGNRTPFALLADLVRDGLEDDLLLWQEWERVSKGKRQLFWSPGRRCKEHKDSDRPLEDCGRCVVGLRQLLGLDEEQTDEAVTEAATLKGEVREYLTAPEYYRVTARRGLAHLLEVAERDDGGEALCAYLNSLGPPIPLEWGL